MNKMLSVFGILALAALAGVFIVQYLVANPSLMYVHLALALAAMVAASLWIARAFPDRSSVLVAALALVFFLGGYLGMNSAFLATEEVRELPAITRAENSPGDGHTAILYFTHGEPPQYNPMPWIETMREFDHDGVEFIPTPFRAFFFYGFRSEYLQIGTSPHNEIHGKISEKLAGEIRTADPQSKLYLAFLDSNPRPDEMMIRAINDGASRVVVMPVFITVSSHTQAGEEMVSSVQPEKFGVEVCYASPLWDSTPLQQSFVEQANARLGSDDKTKTGILLIGHGQPATWDKIYPTQTEQETLFREAIKVRLAKAGYRSENVILAWMEFKDPSIEMGLQELAGNGVERILVFSTSISAKSIHSDIEVPKAIAAAKLPTGIEVTDLGAWGDPNNALVLAAIREKIAACAPEMAQK